MWTKSRWMITPEYQQKEVAGVFNTINKTMLFNEGKRITSDSESEVIKVTLGEMAFYVKRYFCTKGLRSWLGISRIRGEWRNLLLFHQWKIPSAPVVAYGETYFFSRSLRGALITEELRNTFSLSELFYQNSSLLKNKKWVLNIAKQVADATRTMHSHCFIHNDLKWRNILVTTDIDDPMVYFIDCPSGSIWRLPFFTDKKIKDLACLDKLAHKCLSSTVRLRFYKTYQQIEKLSDNDKKTIKKIVNYFRGRD